VAEGVEHAGYVPIGRIPQWVLLELWPGVAVPDRTIWLSISALRRHLQSRPYYIERVAALNRHETVLRDCIAHAVAFTQWDKVRPDEIGVNVLAALPDGDEDERYLLVGVRIHLSARSTTDLNHVATVYPVSERKMRVLLGRHAHRLVDPDETTADP
jgi:hypothetical protein